MVCANKMSHDVNKCATFYNIPISIYFIKLLRKVQKLSTTHNTLVGRHVCHFFLCNFHPNSSKFCLARLFYIFSYHKHNIAIIIYSGEMYFKFHSLSCNFISNFIISGCLHSLKWIPTKPLKRLQNSMGEFNTFSLQLWYQEKVAHFLVAMVCAIHCDFFAPFATLSVKVVELSWRVKASFAQQIHFKIDSLRIFSPVSPQH